MPDQRGSRYRKDWSGSRGNLLSGRTAEYVGVLKQQLEMLRLGVGSIPEDNIDPYQVLLLCYFGEQAIGDGSLVAGRPCWLVLVPWFYTTAEMVLQCIASLSYMGGMFLKS